MVRTVFLIAVLALSLALPSSMHAQAENVPATHPVYTFLKKMSVLGLISHYSETVVPMGRREVAEFLKNADSKRDALSEVERGWLDDYLSEFHFDLTGNTDGFSRLIEPEDSTGGGVLGTLFSKREKFLYYHYDSTVSVFVNGLADLDARWITGDALGRAQSEYLQLGGRIRGSIWGRLGYSLQVTNAGYRGSQDLLQRDPILSQSHALGVTNARNFDFAEGYVRYDGGIVSAEIGHERVLWGNGFGPGRMTLSDNVGVFDFLRADVKYKAFRYTFMHAWLSGQEGALAFRMPFDTSATFYEPVAADKYFAAHRFELQFPKVIDFGFQEMVIYSNRSPDLAYMNPLMLFESAQRARGERDNMFWLFDIRTHFIQGIEFTGTILYDDINIPYFFTRHWEDRYAWQVGMYYADMFRIPNTVLIVEYTRVEPYVFSHGRSREDSYTSLGRILNLPMGPNADNVFFRVDYTPERNLALSARVQFTRKGMNVVDNTGALVQNVGGDVFEPHRDTDPPLKSFLDGVLVKSRTFELVATWEAVNQLWVEARYMFESAEQPATGRLQENTTMFAHLRFEF